MTIKNIIPITIGDIILPNKSPNLNHTLFKGDKIFEFIKPKIKKNNDTKIDQYLRSPSFFKGKIAMIKNTIKKTKPKLLLDPILISLFIYFFRKRYLTNVNKALTPSINLIFFPSL